MRILNSLGLKLTITTAVFLLLLGIATAFLVMAGFRETQTTATQRSIEGLEAQGRSAILDITQQEAQISIDQLDQGAASSRLAANYMENNQASAPASFSFDTLKKHTNGSIFDPNPNRISEIQIPSFTPRLDQSIERDIRQSEVLNAILPTILDEFSNTTAVYFISNNSIARYHPVIGLADISPPDLELTSEPFYAVAAPEANPQRESRWTKPYIDPAGQGVMVTVSTPVYINDEFRGVIGADITLDRLISHLHSLKPTENSFAFMMDRDGQLVVASPQALQALTVGNATTTSVTETLGMHLIDTADPALKTTLEIMMRGDSSGVEVLNLGQEKVFLAYAPLQEVGWSLGIVAPFREVTAQSAAVNSAIEQGIDSTIQTTLVTMIIIFLGAIGLMILLGRRLTQPIKTLVNGTKAVAAGDLGVIIPVTSTDELGVLAGSFNQMTTDLSQAQKELKAWNHTLEQTVEQRTRELVTANTEAEEARTIAEQANRMKSQFLANMSHELRTPLNAIINFSKFILADGGLSEEQEHLIQRVTHNGDHLLGIINDILDLSKIEAGQLEIHQERIALLPMLQSVMATAVGLTKDKGIELILDAPDELPVVWVDKTRTRQVLLNLLSNAAKFTDVGTITVRTFVEDSQLGVAVEDSGIGIDPEDQQRVFEEFQQAHVNLTREYQGTGLGLPISKRLVEMQGGRMWMESIKGEGSTFYFTLPIAPETADVVSTPYHINDHHKGEQGIVDVLVIDDDPDAQTTLQRLLTNSGYHVMGVLDSREAVAAIQKHRPRLIILDIHMPYLGGWDLLAIIKDTPDIATIPVIICSIVDQQRLGVLLGVHGHLVKPVREDALLEAVSHSISVSATVLVVDDDPDARLILRTMLERQGWQVLEAGDGVEGLASIDAHKPDLIVLDLMMPQLDGFGVLSQLQDMPAHAQRPVIVVSAKDLEPNEREQLNRNAAAHLQKGRISEAEFLSLVLYHLQGGTTNDSVQNS